MDETDIGLLIERCYPRIRRAAVLITGNASDAEDLAQETFLQAMRSWHRFDRRCRVETWLYSILVNLDRKRRRGYVRRWRRLVTWFARRQGDETSSPSTAIDMNEPRQAVTDDQLNRWLKRYQYAVETAKPIAVAPTTVRVQRSDVEKKLEELTQRVISLQGEVEKLTGELKSIGSKLKEE